MANYVSIHGIPKKAVNYKKIQKHNRLRHNVNYLKNENNLQYGKNTFHDFSRLEELQEKRKQQQKKFSSIRKNENEIFECVVVFSEEQFSKIEKMKVHEKLIIFCNEMKKNYGFEPLQFDFHLDEGEGEKTNVHAHLVFYNFDFEKNKSVLRNLKKEDMSKMQDLVGQVFTDLGFKRGIKKEITNAKHLKPQEYKNALNNIKQQQQELKALRNELKELKQELELTLQEKKEIEKDLKVIRDNEKLLRKISKEQSEKIIQNSKGFFGFDVSKLKTNIAKIIYTSLHYQTKKNLKELKDKLDKENLLIHENLKNFEKELQEKRNLEKDFESLKNDNEKLEKDNERLRNENNSFRMNINNQKWVIDRLKELEKKEISTLSIQNV